MNPRLKFVQALAGRLPFYYGWVVLFAVAAAAFSRQGPAVATLSIFMDPMTQEFGWTRTEISGAVSLGGMLGAITAPLLGPFLDRNGTRTILLFAVATTALPLLMLHWIASLPMFYLLFCFARMNFAGPYDLGIYGAIVNWFKRKRAFATSVTTLCLMSGLVAMPLIAHFSMEQYGWRGAWLFVGATVMIVGFFPVWLLLVRRPEDIGLELDGGPAPARNGDANQNNAAAADADEPVFTRAQALRTSAFWMLSAYTFLIYPIQAGVSLHQAPALIEKGLDPTIAATAVSTFSLVSAIAGFCYGFWPKRIPMNYALALVGLTLAAAPAAMYLTHSVTMAYVSASLFGLGIGGLLTMLPIAWADYFGRRSFGAIRGVALAIQVIAQATGPLIGGVLRDYSGDYGMPLLTFAVLGCTGTLAALFAKPPKPC